MSFQVICCVSFHCHAGIIEDLCIVRDWDVLPVVGTNVLFKAPQKWTEDLFELHIARYEMDEQDRMWCWFSPNPEDPLAHFHVEGKEDEIRKDLIKIGWQRWPGDDE